MEASIEYVICNTLLGSVVDPGGAYTNGQITRNA